MFKKLGPMVCIVAMGLGGCASNVSQVRERGAIDLGCEPSGVSVELVERPYVGVTRYQAHGCGDTRAYECSARLFTNGVPLGGRACRRAGGGPRPVVAPDGVAF